VQGLEEYFHLEWLLISQYFLCIFNYQNVSGCRQPFVKAIQAVAQRIPIFTKPHEKLQSGSEFVHQGGSRFHFLAAQTTNARIRIRAREIVLRNPIPSLGLGESNKNPGGVLREKDNRLLFSF
jgi:hypothetical protein